jgi:starvation-inducible DNA-binding protein
MATTTLTEPKTTAGTTAELLQATLVELIDLSLQGKQAHWTATGPMFRGVHEQLDVIVDDARTWYDDVAERLAAIGVAPDGRVATVVAGTPLDPAPQGWQKDGEIVDRFTAILDGIAARLRQRMAAVGDDDLITQDVLIGIGRALEKHAWMLRVQGK